MRHLCMIPKVLLASGSPTSLGRECRLYGYLASKVSKHHIGHTCAKRSLAVQ